MSGLSTISATLALPRLPDYQPRQTAAREPKPQQTMEEVRAAYLAAHPRLTPAQAFASNAEASPPNSDNPLDSTYVGKLHTEIKVNGKVIARIYNSGAMVIASEYSFLGDEIFAGHGGGSALAGPDVAEDRANRIKAALMAHGAVMADNDNSANPLSAKPSNAPVLQILKAATAQTQDEWVAAQSRQGALDPGSLLSRAI